MPASSPRAVLLTVAALPPRSSAQRRISSWSWVIFELPCFVSIAIAHLQCSSFAYDYASGKRQSVCRLLFGTLRLVAVRADLHWYCASPQLDSRKLDY